MMGNDLLLALIPASGDAFRAKSLESAQIFLVPVDHLCETTPAHGYSFDRRTRDELRSHLEAIIALIEFGTIEYDDRRHQLALFAAERPSRPAGQDAMELLRQFAVHSPAGEA